MKKEHLPWLDLFRFLAAFIVLIVHIRGFLFVDYGSLEIAQKNLLITVFYFVTRLGKEAVIVFFVLSGFLVGGKAIERLIHGNFNPKSYLIDRIVRLYLPLFPTLILTLCCGLFIGIKFNILELIANILSLQGIVSKSFMGNAPLWSLAYEFWFYTIIISIGFLSIKKKPYIIGGLLLLFICLIVFTILDSTYLFSWIIGALIYFIKPKLNRKILIFSVLMIIVSVLIIQFKIDSKSLRELGILRYLPNLKGIILILSLFFGILIRQLLLINPTRKFWKIVNIIGSKLAAFSYTLYLSHYPLLKVYSYFNDEKFTTLNIYSITIFTLVTIGCLFISFLIYLPFERKTIVYKRLVKNCFNQAEIEKDAI